MQGAGYMARIHFSVCGLGLGHASRCRPIILEAIKRGHDVTVSTYGDAVDYFERVGLSVLKVPAVDYGRDARGAVSIKATLLSNVFLPMKVAAQTLIEARIIEESGAEVVVSDTRASAVLASRLTGIPSTLILNQYNVLLQRDRLPRLAAFFEDIINSFTVVWSLSHRLLIADYPHPLTISTENLRMRKVDEPRAEFVGPILEKLPSDYPPRDRLKEKLGFDPSIPLIAVIPTGPQPDRIRLRDLMMPLLHRQKDFQAIMTGAVGDQSREGLRFVEWYENEYELLAASDVVVTRAGQTLAAKALAFNCRLVLIPIPRQTEQESNAKSLAGKGVAVILKEEDLSLESLSASVKKALDEIEAAAINRYSSFTANVRPVEKILDMVLSL
ncbi:UDP-N-acetylglucosamine--N-acetylmuramyl-(pentapeptide) pyrophosphoryl-undecaprenol N-acetylglucosamine transferase [Candidatus Calditenuaceae archaeon HR02]|nr:UDP-N-acetylglucosamine--N-acetylmuramyl-(pentapeptide) pyrophosphoryl-undecaprenol N-acetylglucosamine transferase [Candidatus Calditenuaceae archaeon HR02]